MGNLVAGVETWLSMRPPGGKPGYWRRAARRTITEALDGLLFDVMTVEAVIKHVDAAYPFGEREHYPYKAWLAERKLLIEALRGPIAMPTKDEADACDVARDLVEEQRLDEARALLDAQAPNRLNRGCPACGVAIAKPCREPYANSMEHAGHGDYGMRELLVPHAARLVGHLDAGPLFTAHNAPSTDGDGDHR